MTPLNFAYWLQGYFELTKAIEPYNNFNDYNLDLFYDCITAHCNLVKKTPGTFDPELVSFVSWVIGAVETKGNLEIIEKKLNNLFEHVIDPMTIGDQIAMSNTHQAYGNWQSENKIIRC
jgi:hypothetical protein